MMLSGKVALVTGGSRGIGRAVASALARAGARVMLSDLNGPGAEETAQALTALGGGEVRAVAGNVAVAAEATAMVEATLAAWGRLDILVNNAGITRDNLLIRLKEEDWDAVLAVNLKGVFLVTQAAVKPMLKQRAGRIVNIASVVGLRGNAGQANYAASKAGVIGFTKTMARELAPRGITVNAVAPGFIKTAMTEALSDEAKERLAREIPLGFLGEPEDVAAAVAFLASDAARYITGQVLCVDGGMVM